MGVGSSSESNGNAAEETSKAKPARTFQEICKGVHMLKNQDSLVSMRSPSPSASPSPSKPEKKSDGEFRLLKTRPQQAASLYDIISPSVLQLRGARCV